MKTVSVSVPDSVLTAIEPGDSVVLRAGRRRLTLKAVAERKPTKAEIRRACELANEQDRGSDDMDFIERVAVW
ncbi:MAG: hypothetical protein BGP20_01405 [Thiobacillus sp. 63-78]|uniref:hypothetical protein n=1 Tax=Thiobacillus sp. 63-78 TaxID=1895859 RepID=UPI000965D854|nr:hypothetical protein [Thiobacillus sp. 63-78]OJZ16208.1 MAG: hypothetical protein BGP20_01405 [Thiobacillus sp. 63-78]